MNNEPNAPPSKRPSGRFRSHSFRKKRPAKPSSPSLEPTESQPDPQAERVKKQELKICKVCGKPIFDLAGAIASRDDGEPIHFDCAIEILSKEETLAPGEKIFYIGSGSFAVCYQAPGGKLEIRRKIRWETAGSTQPWRKPMVSSPRLP
ncbi:MAG: hypothetical protein ACOYVH_02285 [Spirochaetota bacterium]|jgi:hypothetical protein|uniref:hypothetical protein n=1 Tax=Rectinema subterraneum TaxID=2653714 RepID=UPI00131AD48A|nr:hypothetical protein [Rectinema subterraneum]